MNYLNEITKCTDNLEQKLENAIPAFFINTAKESLKDILNTSQKRIGIIGDDFYGLYVSVLGATPVYLSGGSYLSGENASELFPQISDPVAKSAIGMLMDKDLKLLLQLEAVVISASNDSLKKVIFYLKEQNIKVIIADPPVYLLQNIPQYFISAQKSIVRQLEKICKKHLDIDLLHSELLLYKKIEERARTLHRFSLPTHIETFMVETALMAINKNEWCKEAEHYLYQYDNQLLRRKSDRLLLTGSPILFPNDKLYKILGDVGINHFENWCFKFPAFHLVDTNCRKEELLQKCFKTHYYHSFSSQMIKNGGEYDFGKGTKAVLYHLLKGQLSYAYEAEQMEKSAIRQNIPFLCVETDYTNADKEQLKIRIEAFAEMLKKPLWR